MSKKQLEDLLIIPQKSKIPIPLPRSKVFKPVPVPRPEIHIPLLRLTPSQRTKKPLSSLRIENNRIEDNITKDLRNLFRCKKAKPSNERRKNQGY